MTTQPSNISSDTADLKDSYLALVVKLMRMYRRYRSLAAQNARESRETNARRYQESADDIKFILARAIIVLSDDEISAAELTSYATPTVPARIPEVKD